MKIEILDNYKKYNINFFIHPPSEFLQALYKASLEKELVKLCEELGYTPDEEIMEQTEEMTSKLSRFSKQELKYFFNINGGIGYRCLLKFIVNNFDIVTVKEIIEHIEKSDENVFLYNMIGGYIDENLYKKKDYDINDVKNDIHKMKEIIEKSEIDDTETKKNIIECLENPEEAKQRYCMILRQFYDKSYKSHEKDILEILDCHRQKYEKSFKEDPKFFFSQYLSRSLENINPGNVYIHISYFQEVGVSFTDGENHPTWLSIGMYLDRLFGKTAVKEKLQKFFKLLSDKRRIDMIDLLGERPHYVYEMAEKLGLTSATISYHTNFLFQLGLVKYERYDHRLYYSLDKEKLRELFELAKKSLLHE